MSNSFLRDFPKPTPLVKRTASLTLKPLEEREGMLAMLDIYAKKRISHLRIHQHSFEGHPLADQLEDNVSTLLLHDQFCLMELDSYEVCGVNTDAVSPPPVLIEPLHLAFCRSLTILTIRDLRLSLFVVHFIAKEGRNIEKMEFFNVTYSHGITEGDCDDIPLFSPRLREIAFGNMPKDHSLVSSLMRCLPPEGSVAVRYTGDPQGDTLGNCGWKGLWTSKLDGVGSLHLKELSVSDLSNVFCNIFESDLKELCLEGVSIVNGSHGFSTFVAGKGNMVSLRLCSTLEGLSAQELRTMFSAVGRGGIEWLSVEGAPPAVVSAFAEQLGVMEIEVAHLGVVFKGGRDEEMELIGRNIMEAAKMNASLGVVKTSDRRVAAYSAGICGLSVASADSQGKETTFLTPGELNLLRDYAERNLAKENAAAMRSITSSRYSGSPRDRNEVEEMAEDERGRYRGTWQSPRLEGMKRPREEENGSVQ